MAEVIKPVILNETGLQIKDVLDNVKAEVNIGDQKITDAIDAVKDSVSSVNTTIESGDNKIAESLNSSVEAASDKISESIDKLHMDMSQYVHDVRVNNTSVVEIEGGHRVAMIPKIPTRVDELKDKDSWATSQSLQDLNSMVVRLDGAIKDHARSETLSYDAEYFINRPEIKWSDSNIQTVQGTIDFNDNFKNLDINNNVTIGRINEDLNRHSRLIEANSIQISANKSDIDTQLKAGGGEAISDKGIYLRLNNLENFSGINGVEGEYPIGLYKNLKEVEANLGTPLEGNTPAFDLIKDLYDTRQRNIILPEKSGLSLEDAEGGNKNLKINTGNGIAVSDENKLQLDLGRGLFYDPVDNNKLSVHGVQYTRVAPTTPNLSGDIAFVVLNKRQEALTRFMTGYIYIFVDAVEEEDPSPVNLV